MARRKREGQPLRRSARIASKAKLPPIPRPTSSKARSKRETQPPRRSARIAPKSNSPSQSLFLCKLCQDGPFNAQLGLFHPPLELQDSETYKDGGYTYSVDWSWIRGRASDGCVWCKTLKTPISTDCHEITVGFAPSKDCMPVETQRLRVCVNQGKCLFDVFLQRSQDDPAAPYPNRTSPSSSSSSSPTYLIGLSRVPIDAGSTRTLSLAKALVDECVDGHERCRRISPALDVHLPSRLVDCTDLDHPRLVSTRGSHGKYLTLSYVWGEAQPHKTTTSNISAYYDVITRSLLPQTILDAIHVTHTLGFRYLWADSLCIIQDSDEDKLHEIGRMHLIYRHAYLTIIAASAERVSDGFLQDRSAGLSPPINIPFTYSPHTVLRARTEYADVAEDELPSALFEDAVADDYTDEPVDKRGWCLQELYMSPRALVFSSSTLQFRCQETTQNFGNSLHSTRSEFRLPDILFHPSPPPVQPGSKEWRDIYDEWGQIVSRYSQRALGQGSDKLLACGAFAEAFHRVLGSEYLAGLWRDALLKSLLWHQWPRDPRCLEDRPAEYRAPSWSWAAIDGKVKFSKEMDFYPHQSSVVVGAKVVRCDIILKDPEHPFGEVTGGSLVLRARLIPCKVRKNVYKYGAGILLPPYTSDQGSDHFDPYYNFFVEKAGGGHCQIDHFPDLLVERGSDWLVPFWWIADDTDMGWPSAGGLIVTLKNPDPGSPAEKKIYRRIGVFKTGGPGESWGELRHHALEEEDIIIQ